MQNYQVWEMAHQHLEQTAQLTKELLINAGGDSNVSSWGWMSTIDIQVILFNVICNKMQLDPQTNDVISNIFPFIFKTQKIA